jgi:lysozyme
MSVMRGIDINPYKADLDLGAISFDFVLEKATGGNAYVNPDCDNKIQKAIQLGKKWGVFHYFGDGYNDNNPIEEADFFVNNVLGYIGHGILALDWERSGNPNVNRVDMALAWLNHVFERTGVRPIIYMSVSLKNALDWSPVIQAGYGLWAASWPQNNNIIANYGISSNDDPNPTWDGVVNDVIWQFTSSGRLDGYGGNLDCDYFYGTPDAWDAYARPVNTAPNPPDPAPTTTTTQAPIPDPTTTTTTTEPAPTTTSTTTAPENGDGGVGTSTTTTTDTTDTQPVPPAETTTTTTQTDSQDNPPQESGIIAAVIASVIAAVLWLFNRLRGVQ